MNELPLMIVLGIAIGAALPAGSVADATTQPATPPRTFILDGAVLMKTRELALAKDPAVAAGIALLRQAADKQMKHALWTVMDKPEAGPTGDKHDYLSYAPFFFPNPSAPQGLPYILKDGEFNHAVEKFDRYRLIPMSEAVETLALAYYLTGEQPYAQRAADQIRTWFLDPRTKMNPHLKYAQVIRGRNQGSSFGLLESCDFRYVVDAVALLEGSSVWSAEDDRALKQWFDQYLQWLMTSELGKEEALAPNNHGTYYDLQVADFALFLGKTDLARQTLEEAKTKRLAKHIEPNGSQPRELARTMALGYSMMNVTGMCYLARLGQHVDVDLWSFRTADGRSIRAALDFLLPYVVGDKPWTYQQIRRAPHAPMVYILRNAARAYHEPAYERAIPRLQNVHDEIIRINLFYPVK